MSITKEIESQSLLSCAGSRYCCNRFDMCVIGALLVNVWYLKTLIKIKPQTSFIQKLGTNMTCAKLTHVCDDHCQRIPL